MNAVLYIVAVLVWGSTWYAIEFQLGVGSVEAALAYRFMLAGGLLFAWCLLRGRTLRFDRAAHYSFIRLGVFLFGLNYVLAYAAQLYISSALNAVAFSAFVWMNLLNARIFLKQPVDLTTLAGAAPGMLGIAILFWPEIRTLSLTDATLLGASLSLCAAMVASVGNIASQSAQTQGLPVLQSNAYGMFYGGAFVGLVGLAQGKPFVFEVTTSYVVALLYLAVFGSVVAFGCYLTLLGRIGAGRAGYAVVMVPVVALVVSAIFEGLQLTPNVLIGIALAVSGNFMVLANRRRARRLAAAEAAS